MKTYIYLVQALRTVEEKLGVHGDVEILIRRAFGSSISVMVTVRTDNNSQNCEFVVGENGSEMTLASLRFEKSLQALEDRLWRVK